MHPIEVKYTKVQTTKGSPRVWMEGRPLTRAGFEPGMRYERTIDPETGVIELRLSDTGTLIVSERKSKNLPLIEIQNRALSPIVEDVEELRIDFHAGVIRISAERLAKNIVEREKRLIDELSAGFVTKGTLCAGIGMSSLGLSEGLEVGGLQARQEWIVDREGKYLEVAHRNNPAVGSETQIFEASLEQLEPELLKPVSVLNVSLPCTGFSNAGKSRNKISCGEEHRTDATAVFGLAKVLDVVSPSVVCSENVTEARTSATYTLLKGLLSVYGYNIFECELDESQSGSIQRRKRYWFVAVSKGLAAVNLDDVPVFSRTHATLGDLMDNVPADSPEWAEHEYLKRKEEADRAAGKGFMRSIVNEDSTAITTINRTYHKRQSTPSMIRREDGMERLLRPAEIARSMACPESLVDGCSMTLAVEGLGQGVDVNQARGIGMAIARDVFGAILSLPSTVATAAAAAVTQVVEEVQTAVNDVPGNETQISMFS